VLLKMRTRFAQFTGKESAVPRFCGARLPLFWATLQQAERFIGWLLLGMALAAASEGCEGGRQPVGSQPLAQPEKTKPVASPVDPPSASIGQPGASSSALVPSRSPGAGLPERECWYSVSILGAKVGYQQTRIQPVEHHAQPAIRCESFSRLRIHRSGAPLVTEIHFFDLTTAEGVLVELGSEVVQAGSSFKTHGRVQGDQLHLTITTQGKPQELTLPWKPEYGGFHAVEQSLALQPMKPGQRRTLHALAAVVHQVAVVELQALQEETVQLPSGEFRLLKIEATTRFPEGQSFRDVYWVDRTGTAMKLHSQAMNAELLATSRALAENPAALEKLDLALDQAIPLNQPIIRPHQTSRVRYRVRLERGNPAQVFPQTPYQEVRQVDEHTAEVVVWASRPGWPPPKTKTPPDPPTPQDQQPNSFVQSDDPRIAALAHEAVGQEKDRRQQALRLERFVHEYLQNKNFSTAFASALEVLQSREGDCTEHAVLLAALARALGIPARVAIGLVYHEGKFYYHMWNELYLLDRWIAFDATLAEGGIGGAHLLLAHSHLHGASAFSAFLPVLNVLGQGLRIELIDQQ